MTNNILIIGPAWVGDMVMAQCLFKLLKLRDPHVVIDVLAPAWSLPLLKRMPEVGSSLIMPIGHGKLALFERYRLAKKLREKKYSQAIVLPNSFKSALIPFWAKIPVRTGWFGEMRYGLLNDVRLNKKRYSLMIEQFMALGLLPHERMPNKYFVPELLISPESVEQTRVKFNLDLNKPILILCPGAEFGPAKRWPENYFAEVANAKLKEGWNVWLLGSAKDSAVTKQIMELTQNKCLDFAGKTTLEEAIDLISLATHVLTNDSGLMHIAAALKKSLVAIYGPTSEKFTPPLNEDAKIKKLSLDCQPCFKRECPIKHHRCMQELKPEIILKELGQ